MTFKGVFLDKKVLLIIPCFNEEQNIVQLLHDIQQIEISGYSFFPLPINDNSRDATLTKIQTNSTLHLNLINNLGIGGAVQSGIKYAQKNNFDLVIQMDGDGQHPVSELHKLIHEINSSNSDICIGSRYINQEGFQSSFSRRLGISLLNKIILLTTGRHVFDCTAGFRLYNKKAIDLFTSYYPDKYPEPESIVYALLNGLKVKEVPVIMKEREGGVTSISRFYTVYYMVKVSLAIIFLKIGFTLNIKK